MLLTVEEMGMLCALYQGTVSATLELLREVKSGPPERIATASSLIEKLSGMKAGETVSLAFEPEK